MAKTADALREEVLALPVHDRARLATDLLASLDQADADEDDVDRSWSLETERRAASLESGDAAAVGWEHVLARIDERRADRRA